MKTTVFGDDNTPQDLYFPDNHPTMPGWFKGMETIIRKHGLWPEKGLNAQCEGFKCVAGKKDCCCRRLLFTQPDFVKQISHLEELITLQGHICDFYPKYHLVMDTGVPRGILLGPAPAPAENPSRSDGCRIPAHTGMGSNRTHGK
jgi:hypothetical protein